MRWICAAILLLTTRFSIAQEYTISGRISDREGGVLPMAHIISQSSGMTFVADSNGKFLFRQPAGNVSLEFRFTGYEAFRLAFMLRRDTTLAINLSFKSKLLEEVIIKGSQVLQSDQLESTRTSTLTLSEKEISAIPVLGGEADLIKTIQLLPGVTKGVEGTTDLFVRGGAADQNLVLLDGAPVYNTGHLFGFLSVFNPDILDGVESINGAFPSQFGGRLSSILNVQSKSRFSERTSVAGNIGVLASRLMVRQPIVRNKLEFWVAGRRTYVDQVVKTLGESLPYFFDDVNVKGIYQPTPVDRIEITHYSGKDVLNFVRTGRDTASNFRFTSDFRIANSGQTFSWKRDLKRGVSSHLQLYRSKFNYTIENQFEDSRLFTNSSILDFGTKWLLRKQTERILWSTGLDVVNHQVSPNVINTSGEIAQLLESSATRAQTSLESSLFFQADGQWKSKWTWSAGIRASSASVNNTLYLNPEPRFAVRFKLSENAAWKASYSRMAQYLHRISSAAVAFPTDIWYPVTSKVRPQTSNQITLAYQRKIPHKNLFINLEGYYKTMDNMIGYREGTNLFLNTDFESQMIQGLGKAYGIEFLLKKEAGKLTGWISYTLSKSLRSFEELTQGNWFYARYDRRHNGALVVNYELSKKFSLSGVFEFISGSRFTPIIGQYIVPTTTLAGVQLVPVYAPLNSVKLADTHRLDLGLKFIPRPAGKFKSEWFVGVYNVYNRAMPIGINIEPNEDGTYRYEQPGLFGLLPFVSYGFKF